MPKYHYVALDARGQESTGVIEAPSSNEAAGQLRRSGYYPTSVTEKAKRALPTATKKVARPALKAPAKVGKGIVLFQRRTVSAKSLMIFTRQLATLIDAGLPLLRGLTVLAKQEKDVVLKRTITQLGDTVQGGGTFSESLAQHPRIFNKLYINMVKAGELGGVLDLVLSRLAEFQEKAQKIKNKVVSAMFYPVTVLCIAITIMGFLLVFIVPKFERIFDEMLGGKPLPALTRFVISASNTVKQAFWPTSNLLITLAIVGLIIASYLMISRSRGGRAMLDQIKLKIPLFGDLLLKGAISRFSRTLGTLVTSGVPILQALIITKETAGNEVVAEAILKVHESVKEGDSIVQPLEASGVFPPMVISMIDVGEETGRLPEMLLKVAEVYDEEVDNAVAGLTSLLEPLMIVFLAVIVGTIVIALFLPLISIIQEMQSM